jgi:hypothetical protein
MANDPEGLVTFEAGGERYTAVFGFKAMKAVEAHYDLPFFQALQQAMPDLSAEEAQDPAKVAAAGASVRMTAVGKLFEAALMKHHPGLTEDQVDNLIDEIGIEAAGDILGRSVSSALVKREGDGKSPANPRGKRS